MNGRDDELLELVGRALRAAEPVPEHVITGALAAWTWRTIDAELAELVFDSATELTGVRSEDTARQVTFQAPGVEIEVMVIDDAVRRIVGQLDPGAEMTVELPRRRPASSTHPQRPPRPVRVRRGPAGPGAPDDPRRRGPAGRPHRVDAALTLTSIRVFGATRVFAADTCRTNTPTA